MILCTYRWYDTKTAQWITRDPIGYEGGVNLYAYCSGNPVMSADPSGLKISFSGMGVDDKLENKLKREFRKWAEGTEYAKVYDWLEKNAMVTIYLKTIKYNVDAQKTPGDQSDAWYNKIYWDVHAAAVVTPDKKGKNGKIIRGKMLSPFNALGHELTHLYGSLKDPAGTNTVRSNKQYDNTEEARVIKYFEAPTSRKKGEYVRKNHNLFYYIYVTDPRSSHDNYVMHPRFFRL